MKIRKILGYAVLVNIIPLLIVSIAACTNPDKTDPFSIWMDANPYLGGWIYQLCLAAVVLIVIGAIKLIED